jgi:predicted dehydrogenase
MSEAEASTMGSPGGPRIYAVGDPQPRADQTTVRVAVVGYGYWGAKHARVLSSIPGVTPAVVDQDDRRLADARAVLPDVRTAADLSDLADWADAAVVATPPRSHAPIASAAIEYGLDVLVEKPLAVSVPECEQLIAASERAGVILMVGHTFEHNGAVWKLREIVNSGELGEICYIDSARLSLGLYQDDLNVIWDLAPHDLSIVNFLLGREPESVSAWGRSHVGAPGEDVAYLKLGYGGESLAAYVHVSWLDPCKVRRVTVVGRNKMVVYNDVAASEPIRIYDSGVDPADVAGPDPQPAPPVSYRLGDVVSPRVAMQEPLLVEDNHFVDCIRTRSRPRSDGESGLAVVRVLEAADLALAEGVTTPVNGHQLDWAAALGMEGRPPGAAAVGMAG